jgi:hypothetical protein
MTSGYVSIINRLNDKQRMKCAQFGSLQAETTIDQLLTRNDQTSFGKSGKLYCLILQKGRADKTSTGERWRRSTFKQPMAETGSM